MAAAVGQRCGSGGPRGAHRSGRARARRRAIRRSRDPQLLRPAVPAGDPAVGCATTLGRGRGGVALLGPFVSHVLRGDEGIAFGGDNPTFGTFVESPLGLIWARTARLLPGVRLACLPVHRARGRSARTRREADGGWTAARGHRARSGRRRGVSRAAGPAGRSCRDRRARVRRTGAGARPGPLDVRHDTDRDVVVARRRRAALQHTAGPGAHDRGRPRTARRAAARRAVRRPAAAAARCRREHDAHPVHRARLAPGNRLAAGGSRDVVRRAGRCRAARRLAWRSFFRRGRWRQWSRGRAPPPDEPWPSSPVYPRRMASM
jgi:hypothetical protein